MGEEENHPPGAEGIQVFELTMDNPEDQDELNRRLRKPGESDLCASPKDRRAADSESLAEGLP